MNRQSMLAHVPKTIKSVPKPGMAPDVAVGGIRKPKPVSVAPQAASTRMYGKAAPDAMIGPSLFGDRNA